MIPKKNGPDVNLNSKIDEDLQKAQEQQNDKIKKNKPKLAQAVGSKYFKFIIVIAVGLGIGYKMFFAPEPEQKVKKKVSKKIDQKDEQKKFANETLGKSEGAIAKKSDAEKEILSLDNQRMSNKEILNKVAVPQLSLPQVPEIPKIDKLTIKETVVEEDKSKTLPNDNKEIKQQNEKNKNEKKEENKIPVLDKDKNDKNDKNNKKNTKPSVKKKKIQRKIKDKNGKTVLVTEEVDVDEHGNIVNKPESDIVDTLANSNLSLSQQLSEELDTSKKKKVKNSQSQSDKISNIGVESLEKMFIMSGKGTSKSKRTQSSGKKDFILFDGSTIQEKEPLNENNASINKLTNLDNTIASGKIMEGVLATAINSESAGTVRAIISKDVYGEAGSKILIPKGSSAYGSYTTTVSKTQRRLLLTWTKIIRPDGIVISMTADTYDQSGKKGIEGDVDTRYGELFKNSLLYSFITLGSAIAIEKLTGIKNSTSITAGGTTITNSPATTAVSSVVDTAKDIAEKMTDGLTDDLDPIISIPQGTVINIISNTDILVPVAYKRRNGNANF